MMVVTNQYGDAIKKVANGLSMKFKGIIKKENQDKHSAFMALTFLRYYS